MDLELFGSVHMIGEVTQVLEAECLKNFQWYFIVFV